MAWQEVRDQDTLLGSFLSFGSPHNAEMMGAAGFDFLVIDLEHGSGGEADVLPQLWALSRGDTRVVVRVESHDSVRVQRLLDLGVHGIMFPRVNTLEQAQSAARAMRYSPTGSRGVASLVRASDYGMRFEEYLAENGAGLLTIAQIETPEAVENAEAIAGVEGIDVLFVGPMDLSQSLGIFGKLDDARFTAALEATAAAVQNHNKVAAILMRTPDEFTRYHKLGFRFFTCGSDAGLLAGAAKALSAELKSNLAKVGARRFWR